MLELLAQGERTVESLARGTGMGVTNTFAHLQGLRHARLVDTHRDRTRVFYRLAGDEVAAFVAAPGRRGCPSGASPASRLPWGGVTPVTSRLTISDPAGHAALVRLAAPSTTQGMPRSRMGVRDISRKAKGMRD